MTKALKITACSLLAALILGTAFLCGCSSYQHDIGFYSMGSTAILSAYISPTEEKSSDDLFDDLCYDIYMTLEDVDASLETSAPAEGEEASSVYLFNEADAGDTVEIDSCCYEVLSLALEMYEKTDGYFNPAVYYSVAAYGFGENGWWGKVAYTSMTKTQLESTVIEKGSKEEGTEDVYASLPSDEEIAAYVELSESFHDIELSVEDGKYYVTKPEKTVTAKGETLSMKIDLGGVGKGYATDIVSDIMDDYGVEFGYFNFAGSSLAIKRFDDESRDWCYELTVTNPRDTSDCCATMDVRDCKLSTSGDYEQYYTIDEKTYCHIINPKTGSPIETGIMSATVLDGSAAENDCYTTALMAMGIDEAVSFVKENLSDKRVVLIYEQDGEYCIEANFDGVEIEKESGFISYDIFK